MTGGPAVVLTLTTADRVKIDRLLAALTDITTITQRIKVPDRQIPAVLSD